MRFVRLTCSVALAAAALSVPATATAHGGHDDGPSGAPEASPHPVRMTAEAAPAMARLRAALRPLRDPEAAIAAGYLPSDECVENADGTAAMGYHYVNLDIFFGGPADVTRPPVLVYVPTADGGRTLGAAEWAALDGDQDVTTDEDRPTLAGLPFDGPMLGHEPGQPIHYDLHAWLFHTNPAGVFTPYNPRVHC